MESVIGATIDSLFLDVLCGGPFDASRIPVNPCFCASTRFSQDPSYMYQVGGSVGKGEDPLSSRNAFGPSLEQERDRHLPPKTLFHNLALASPDLASQISSCSNVNGALSVGVILRNVRRHAKLSHLRDKIALVIVLISSQ
jgi:hypothetical protein